MKVLMWPQDPNPYQHRLRAALADLGIRSEFCGAATRSHTLNVLLLPLSVLAGRVHGFRIFHLHWVYRFAIPVVGGWRPVRRLLRAWFAMTLWVVQACGMRLVWTAHNVLPHQRVFDDDVAGRRMLLRSCDGLVVHSERTADELRGLGWPVPDLVAVIPPAPTVDPSTVSASQARRALGVAEGVVVIGMVGRIDPYKGADDLLSAVTSADPPLVDVAVVIAGRCADPALAARLSALAAACPVPVTLELRALDELEYQTWLACLDVFVAPFRRITTSGSVLGALAAGLGVLVPDHVGLEDIPGHLLRRYTDLAAELSRLATERDVDDRDAHRRAASSWARRRTWAQVADETAALYQHVIDAGPARRIRGTNNVHAFAVRPAKSRARR